MVIINRRWKPFSRKKWIVVVKDAPILNNWFNRKVKARSITNKLTKRMFLHPIWYKSSWAGRPKAEASPKVNMNIAEIFPSIPFCILTLSFFSSSRTMCIYFIKAAYDAAPGPDAQGECLLNYILTSFLYLSCSFSFSDMGCLKGNCLGNHAMCVSHALRMNHALPAGSIKIAITAALLLILFYTRIMMNWNETQKLHASLDDLISDAKFLPLMGLCVFLSRECGNFNEFERLVRYLWYSFLLVYIKGYIHRIFFVLT